jgi:DNA invertase Pin-like site-specific DNA recombinase
MNGSARPCGTGERSSTTADALVDDEVGDDAPAVDLERRVAVVAAEDDDRQAGALAVALRAQAPPDADRVDDDDRQPGLEHLLDHHRRRCRSCRRRAWRGSRTSAVTASAGSARSHVHSAAEQLDTSTANGRFIRDIHLANAVRERERARRPLRRAAPPGDRGRGLAAPPDPDRLRPRPADPQARAQSADAGRVRRAFRDRAGVSLSRIAEDLGMTTSGVRQLLANRVYLGELRVGSYVNETAHEPLVTVDEFLAAQSAQCSRGPRVRDEPALLAGLVRCAGCGHVMSRGRTKAEVYACHGRMSAGRCPAPAA